MADRLSELAPQLDALRHDLGKYVCFQARGIPDDSALLREALCADLLATQRSPRGTSDALMLWDALAPELASLRGDATFDALEADMERLRGILPLLRDGSLPDAVLPDAASLARAVAQRCSHLWARARKPAGG